MAKVKAMEREVKNRVHSNQFNPIQQEANWEAQERSRQNMFLSSLLFTPSLLHAIEEHPTYDVPWYSKRFNWNLLHRSKSRQRVFVPPITQSFTHSLISSSLQITLLHGSSLGDRLLVVRLPESDHRDLSPSLSCPDWLIDQLTENSRECGLVVIGSPGSEDKWGVGIKL